MRKKKQLAFSLLEVQNIRFFGGSLLKKSNPKRARPLSIKRCSHLVMRSSHAVGQRSLLKHAAVIERLVFAHGKSSGVKIYRYANGGNHLHLLVLPSSRRAFHRFIRGLTGVIARLVMDVERGPSNTGERRTQGTLAFRFWDQRPFTRIVEWGRDFRCVCDYLLQNTFEALGFVAYQPRKFQYRLSTA